MIKCTKTWILALAGLVVVCALPAWAADAPAGKATFTKDILPILQDNCQVCHREAPVGVSGMVAPMPFMTYEQVRPWAKAIARNVQSRYMPPWGASAEFHGVFENERSLTDEEITKILTWTKTGASKGRPEDAPEPLVFANKKWWLGEPDLEVSLPEPYFVEDDVEDIQPMFYIPLTEEMLPEDRWLQGIECRPDSEVVHHFVVYAIEPGVAEDEFRRAGLGTIIGGLAPGAEQTVAREGYGYLLKKGTTVGVSMHYHKEVGPGTGAWDQSSLGLHFYPKDAKVKPVTSEPIGNLGFEIPPGHSNWMVGMAKTFERPITLLSMLPHMHFRGAAAEYVAFFPDGTSEKILDVPNYDYAWQHRYSFKKPMELPAGTRLEVKMWFNNSVENPDNPNPARAVRFGGPTTDEMALGWISYAYADEERITASAGGL